MENQDLESMSDEELQAYIDGLQADIQSGSEVPTDTSTQPDQVQQPLRKDNKNT